LASSLQQLSVSKVFSPASDRAAALSFARAGYLFGFVQHARSAQLSLNRTANRSAERSCSRGRPHRASARTPVVNDGLSGRRLRRCVLDCTISPRSPATARFKDFPAARGQQIKARFRRGLWRNTLRHSALRVVANNNARHCALARLRERARCPRPRYRRAPRRGGVESR
jgi:hypothetical protein